MDKKEKSLKRLTDKIKHYSKNYNDAWSEKLWISAKRVLSASIFYVSGKTVYKRKNYLLPPIAFYYSLFHLSKALLFILPHRNIGVDSIISHSKTINLIKNEFIDRKLLDFDFYSQLDYWRNVRESVNYDVERWIYLDIEIQKELPCFNVQFKKGIFLYEELCVDDFHYPRAVISDGIGDDMCDAYLSRKEEEELWEFLLDLGVAH